MPFRYFGHTIRIVDCPEEPGLFLASVTSPDGHAYGLMGFGNTPLDAPRSAQGFVDDLLAMAAGTYTPPEGPGAPLRGDLRQGTVKAPSCVRQRDYYRCSTASCGRRLPGRRCYIEARQDVRATDVSLNC
jgi:hypothetical protein